MDEFIKIEQKKLRPQVESFTYSSIFFIVSSFRQCGYYLSLIITTEYGIPILPKVVSLQLMYYNY